VERPEETQRMPTRDERRIRKPRTPGGEVSVRAVGKKVLIEGVVPRAREELHVRSRTVDEITPDHRVGAKVVMRVPLRQQDVILERRPFVAEVVRVRTRPVRGTARQAPNVRHEEPDIERVPLPREDAAR
jgi:uncharacterized protein (TIGR02271 family)